MNTGMVFVPTMVFLLNVARAYKEIILNKQPRMTIIQKYRDLSQTRVEQEKLFKYIQLGLKHHDFLNHISTWCNMDTTLYSNASCIDKFVNIAMLCHLLSPFLEMEQQDSFNAKAASDVKRNAYFVKQKNAFDTDAWDGFIRCLLAGRWIGRQESMPPRAWLSIRYSHPQYLVKKLVDLAGIERTRMLLERHQQDERFFLLAKNEATIVQVKKYLKSKGFVFQNDRFFTNLIHVPSIPGWKHNIIANVIERRDDVIMQDLGSVAVVEALGIDEGDVILDACAAPFQKTLAISWKCKPRGMIVAIDRHESRVAGNVERMGRPSKVNWYILNADSTGLDKYLRTFVPDKILIDAPCSGSGSIAGYPELKFLQDDGAIARFSSIQRNICASVIKVARHLNWKQTEIVYSTCSYFSEEGEEVIDSFNDEIDLMDLHDPDSSPVASVGFSPGWKGFSCSTRVMRTFPDRDSSRAFFIAKFKVRQ